MNYYERHLGDIAKDTAHLSALEFGIYDLLMDRYYASEKPIPLSDIFRIARARTKEEKSSAEYVVSEFFQEHDGCIFHKRIDAEIEKYHEKKPKREKEKADAAERQKRARDRRVSLFEALRERGVVPHIKTTTTDLERMILEHDNKQVSQQHHGSVTRDDTLTNPQSPIPTNEITNVISNVADSGESSADENKKPKFTDADRELAIHMLAAVQKISPSMKAAKSWPDDIRLMRERDNHTLDEIREMFDWANADPFWSANILSPGKLRDKWAQLEAQRNRPKLAVVNGKQSAHGGFEHIDYTKGINADGSF